MDLLTVVVFYCCAVGAFFIGLWLFYGRREYAFFEHARRKTTFLCARCNKLYAAPATEASCACPRCGHDNYRLKF